MPIDESKTFVPLKIALVTISDTRTEANDTSGDYLADAITSTGHHLIARTIVTDDTTMMSQLFREWIDNDEIQVIISTGGTGITGRDNTPEVIDSLAERKIPGFGELFRMLSYESIGTSALQSRACAAVAGGTLLFALPGSNGAVKDGWQKILKFQLDSRHGPCNFVALFPRLNEV